jgi:putative selenate reductase molybdopterin-binding subunit
MNVTFTLNGKKTSAQAAPGESAQVFLQRLGIWSVRNSDDSFGFAGSDTVLLDGRPIGANILLAPQLEGRDVKTVEFLKNGRSLHVIQQSMLDAGCVQSGYNSPAAALLIYELLQRNPEPDRDAVADALSGMFNRSNGYRQFFDAVALAAGRLKDPSYRPPEIPVSVRN